MISPRGLLRIVSSRSGFMSSLRMPSKALQMVCHDVNIEASPSSSSIMSASVMKSRVFSAISTHVFVVLSPPEARLRHDVDENCTLEFGHAFLARTLVELEWS